MKKIITMFLLIALALSLITGCVVQESKDKDSSSETKSVVVEEAGETISTEELEKELEEIDSLEEELDLSELDSLEQDLENI